MKLNQFNGEGKYEFTFVNQWKRVKTKLIIWMIWPLLAVLVGYYSNQPYANIYLSLSVFCILYMFILVRTKSYKVSVTYRTSTPKSMNMR